MTELLTQRARRKFLKTLEGYDDKRHRVFVYGTLMRGYANNYTFLQGEDTVFMGNACTSSPMYLIYSGGPGTFPVACDYMPETSVTEELQILGELYDVSSSTLLKMDQLEGEGYMYDRKRRPVVDGEAVSHIAEMYVGVPSFWEKEQIWATDCPIEAYKGVRYYRWKRGAKGVSYV